MDDGSQEQRGGERQLFLPLSGGGGQIELPLRPPVPAPISVRAPERRAFRVLKGEGKRRDERLKERGDVVRLLTAAAADLLLRRITPARAHELEVRVERVMGLFDRIGQLGGTDKKGPEGAEARALKERLERELRSLDALWRESDARRR